MIIEPLSDDDLMITMISMHCHGLALSLAPHWQPAIPDAGPGRTGGRATVTEPQARSARPGDSSGPLPAPVGH